MELVLAYNVKIKSSQPWDGLLVESAAHVLGAHLHFEEAFAIYEL